MHLPKLITLILSSAISLLVISFLSAPEADAFKVNFKDETLAVTADNVALQTILLELVAQGITVKIDPAINPTVSANFTQQPIEQALKFLLKSTSYSLLWESKFPHSDTPSLRLAEIQIFQTGGKVRMQTLQSQEKETITKTADGIFYVKDEILVYIPSENILAELQKILQEYNAILIETNKLPGLVRIRLPRDSDVFVIAREIKNRLDLEIAQPHYAYPIQDPVHYQISSDLKPDLDPGYYNPTDNNIPIAILDSGLTVNSGLDKFVFSSLDVMDPEAPIKDTLGHGTQMALIASGIVKPHGTATDTASYIPIIPIRAFDDNGYTTDLKIVDAINFALNNNARVMSLSWGSETRSDIMEKAFTEAGNRGLIIVASAGNKPTGKPVYPAAYPSVIGIGALGPDNKTWENSNFGDFVTFYAPGFALLPVGYKGDPGMYAGTSISTAFAANTIAGYLSENPNATQQEISNYLNKTFK